MFSFHRYTLYFVRNIFHTEMIVHNWRHQLSNLTKGDVLPFVFILTFQHVEQGEQQSPYFCEGQVFAWHYETSVHLPQIFLRKMWKKVRFLSLRWTIFFHFQNTWKQTLVHSRTACRSRSRTDYRQTANGLARKLLFAKCRGSVQTVETKRK